MKQITALETLPIRQIVLRDGKPIEECTFTDDHLDSTIHFGVYKKKILAGVATFLEKNHPNIKGEHLQLRGMAVLDEYRGAGLGKLLLMRGEGLAKEKKKNSVWFNARLSAVPFYEKSGYQVYGNSFLIEEIGIHFVMYKEIN